MSARLVNFIAFIFCFLLANTASSDCLLSYRQQIDRESFCKDKSPYRTMQLALANAQNTSSKHFRKWHELLAKNNRDYAKFRPSTDEVSYALVVLNEEDAFCKEPKPFKAKVAAATFFDLLSKHQSGLLRKIEEKTARIEKIYQKADSLLETYQEIKNCDNVFLQLELYGNTLIDSLAPTDTLRKETNILNAGISLFNKVQTAHSLLMLEEQKINYYLSLDYEKLRIDSLDNIEKNSTVDNKIWLSSLLVVLKKFNNLDFNTFETLRNMTSVQIDAFKNLKEINYGDSLNLASFIINQWALEALIFSIKSGIFKQQTNEIFNLIPSINSEAEFVNFKERFVQSPSQVIAKKVNMAIPQDVMPIYNNEVALVCNDFIVAYHNIPDTSCQPTLPIYIFQAYVAQIIYGVILEMLPRFRKKPFEVWPTVGALKGSYSNDHDIRWRDIGIAASPSLMSNTESPPSATFRVGYTGSGATKPICASLIENILIDLGFTLVESQDLARNIAQQGMHLFNGVGGSILQVGVKTDVVRDYAFLCGGYAGIKYTDEPMLSMLKSVTYETSDQIRIISDPSVFLDSNKSRLIHYPYYGEKYQAAKKSFVNYLDQYFREQLRYHLFDKKHREMLIKNLRVKDGVLSVQQ